MNKYTPISKVAAETTGNTPRAAKDVGNNLLTYNTFVFQEIFLFFFFHGLYL